MPFPILAAAALAAVPGIFKTVSGISQATKGKRALKNIKRPEYFKPEEAIEASRIAQNQYLQKGLPGQELMENRAMGVTARGVNDAKAVSSSSGDALDAVTKLYAGEQQQMQNIGLAAAQQDLQDAATYRQQLGLDADYADKKWDINVFQPYAQKYGEAKANIAAGNQNISSGLDSIGQIGTSALMGKMAQGPTMGEALGQQDLMKVGSTMGNMQGYSSIDLKGMQIPFSAKGITAPTVAPPTFGTNRQMVFDPNEPFKIKWRND